MKTILLILFCALTAHTKDLKLVWNYPNTNGTTFHVYEQVGASNIWRGVVAGSTSFVVSNVVPGLKTFSVIASNGLASDPTIVTTNLPAPVQNLTIEVTQVIESAPSPSGPWSTESNSTAIVVAADPSRFYRGRIATRRIE